MQIERTTVATDAPNQEGRRSKRRSGRSRRRSARRRAFASALTSPTTPASNAHSKGSPTNWLAALPPLLIGLNQVALSMEKTARKVREASNAPSSSSATQNAAPIGSPGSLPDFGSPGSLPDLGRYTQTGLMLAKVAASYRLHGFQSAFMAPEPSATRLDSVHAQNARRFYQATAKHGGAFLKVGQLLSGRADLMPATWIEQLRKLQDAAPEVSFEEIKRVVELEFGAPLETLYSDFDPNPIAAASIGQVHKAVTRDGLTVAVKIQRPGIASAISGDMQLLKLFVKAMADSLPDIDHATLLQNIQVTLDLELDYVREAKNTHEMSTFLAANVEGVCAPSVVNELCGQKVITTGFIDGQNLSRALDALHVQAQQGSDEAHTQLSDLLGKLLESYLRQVLQAGTFQADAHPGNFLVTPEGELVVLDFGCTQELSEAQRVRYGAILKASFSGDRERLATLLFEAGFETESGRPDTLLSFCDGILAQLCQLMANSPEQAFSADGWKANAAKLWSELKADPVTTLPPDFLMLARVFMSLGGLITHYQPTINIERHMIPVLGELS